MKLQITAQTAGSAILYVHVLRNECSSQKGAFREVPHALDAVCDVRKLIRAVVYPLLVLVDVRPRVRRGP